MLFKEVKIEIFNKILKLPQSDQKLLHMRSLVKTIGKM